MSPTPVGCHEPGCPGSIIDDYCDVCGTPGTGGTVTAAPTAAALSTAVPTPLSTIPSTVTTPAAPLGTTAGACRQPGCSGTVVDGYCDVCGTPGAPTAPAAATPAPGSPAARAARESDPLRAAAGTASTASRIESAAIGSRRAGAGSTSTGVPGPGRSGCAPPASAPG